MRGFTLLELLVVLALVSLFVMITMGNGTAVYKEQNLDHLAKEVEEVLEMCRWKALNTRIYAGALIEQSGEAYRMRFYADGNGNGIRTVDIQKGIDAPFRGEMLLTRESGHLGVGILDGAIPEIPPKRGTIQGDDPVRFGRSNLISFSPQGDSSSGSLFLSCPSQDLMYAVVIYGPTARMRLWKFKNFKWQMVGDQ